jgi:hypothetical protein
LTGATNSGSCSSRRRFVIDNADTSNEPNSASSRDAGSALFKRNTGRTSRYAQPRRTRPRSRPCRGQTRRVRSAAAICADRPPRDASRALGRPRVSRARRPPWQQSVFRTARAADLDGADRPGRVQVVGQRNMDRVDGRVGEQRLVRRVMTRDAQLDGERGRVRLRCGWQRPRPSPASTPPCRAQLSRDIGGTQHAVADPGKRHHGSLPFSGRSRSGSR